MKDARLADELREIQDLLWQLSQRVGRLRQAVEEGMTEALSGVTPSQAGSVLAGQRKRKGAGGKSKLFEGDG